LEGRDRKCGNCDSGLTRRSRGTLRGASTARAPELRRYTLKKDIDHHI